MVGDTMAKSKTAYRCKNCDKMYPKWQGRCDQCNEWGSLEEEIVMETKKTIASASRRNINGGSTKAVLLKDVKVSKNARIVVKNEEFNRVMGGGIVRDSVTLITAPPGSGKSTLLLMISEELGNLGLTVYYVSGEESLSQIKSRAERVAPNVTDKVWIQSETNLETIVHQIQEIDPDIIIVDSIQTIYSDKLPSRAGTPTQVDETISTLIELAKNPKRPRAVMGISQMTKEDELAGSRSLEHAVDAVLYLEGDRSQQLRTLYCNKNRFGEAGEVGLLAMQHNGLVPIDNPSEFFMTKREVPIAGSALTVTREGSRNIVVEVESLVERTLYGFPTRVSEGINKQQLQILCGTLEKRAGLRVSDKDVYVKIVAGLKPKETAINLGVMMSIVSSVYGKGIMTDTVFIGEVGLTGEIKTVPFIESRIKELDRLGFKKVYVPKDNIKIPLTTKQIEIIEVSTLDETITHVYGKKKDKSA